MSETKTVFKIAVLMFIADLFMAFAIHKIMKESA